MILLYAIFAIIIIFILCAIFTAKVVGLAILLIIVFMGIATIIESKKK